MLLIKRLIASVAHCICDQALVFGLRLHTFPISFVNKPIIAK